jgi:putative peptidoglycan binding protein
MPTNHTVVDGEHLSGIADRYGFRDFRTVWDDAGNAQLRDERGEAHVLHPGDVVVVPDKQQRNESRSTDDTHRFRVRSKPLMLRLALTDFHNQPIAGTACELTIQGQTLRLTSDGDGIIETPIPKNATDGVLKIPELDLELPVRIGHLDPVDEDAGWQGRLVNLGYYPGAVGDDDAQQFRHAIEEFQCDHGLKVNGELDGPTRAKLLEAHGA